MQSEMQVSIKLTPVFDQDKRTGQYLAYFDQFPQAMGTGNDKEEAAKNLITSFTLMINERNHDIKEQIVEKYMGAIQFNNHNMHTA